MLVETSADFSVVRLTVSVQMKQLQDCCFRDCNNTCLSPPECVFPEHRHTRGSPPECVLRRIGSLVGADLPHQAAALIQSTHTAV